MTAHRGAETPTFFVPIWLCYGHSTTRVLLYIPVSITQFLYWKVLYLRAHDCRSCAKVGSFEINLVLAFGFSSDRNRHTVPYPLNQERALDTRPNDVHTSSIRRRYLINRTTTTNYRYQQQSGTHCPTESPHRVCAQTTSHRCSVLFRTAHIGVTAQECALQPKINHLIQFPHISVSSHPCAIKI